MIRKLVENQFDADKKYVEIACLSTDTKPVSGIITGSLAIEVDTGDAYLFNEEGTSGSEWVKVGGGNE